MEDDLELVLPGQETKSDTTPVDPYREEVESAKKMILQDRPDPRSYGQIASDTLENIKGFGRAVLPTALGGEGTFGPFSGMYYGAKNALDTGTKMISGEIPLFDERGRPTEEAIAGSTNIAGMLALDGKGLGSNAVGPSFASRAADARIRAAIESDRKQGQIRGIKPGIGPGGSAIPLPGLTSGQVEAAVNEGLPVTGYDLSGGANTKALVERSARNAGTNEPVVNLQQTIANRMNEGRSYLARTVDSVAGKELSTGDEFETAVKNISDTNDPAYKRVMALPGNQSLYSPRLKSILENRPVFRRILKERSASMENADLAPPAIYDANGNINLHPANAPSLEYLNSVYKAVREEVDNLYKAGKNEEAKDLKAASSALRDELDNLAEKNPDGSSSYKSVRDDASELFGARNSLEAGYNYLNKAGPMKLVKIMGDYDRYTPSQKEQFRVGLLSRIKDDLLNPSKTNTTAAYLDGSNPAMFDKISGIIGSENATRLGNQVRIQRIMNAVKTPDLAKLPESGGSGIGVKTAMGIGAAGVVGAEHLAEMAPQVAHVMSNPTTGALALGAGAGAIYALKKIISTSRNAYEASVARNVLDAVTSGDPAVIQRLDNIPPSALGFVLDKMGPTASYPLKANALTPQSAKEDQGSDLELVLPGKMNGGRIGRKSGGRAISNPISAEVKRVRALLSEKTASMLSVPDDAIATALHIAKET